MYGRSTAAPQLARAKSAPPPLFSFPRVRNYLAEQVVEASGKLPDAARK